MTRYGVQAGGLSDKIWVGQINKTGTEFTHKEDLTADVLHAVAVWVEQNHGGAAWVKIGGKRIDIEVKPADDESDRGAA